MNNNALKGGIQMVSYFGNSFFECDYSGMRALILVPHEDDEILAAGSLIYMLVNSGAEVFIAYATNGDWKSSAKKRHQEAIKAADILGVSSEHVLFMGYGDYAPEDASEHLFYHKDVPVQSPAGYLHTYGTKTHDDFAFRHHGIHHDYTSHNYLNDIVEIIDYIHPNLIVCSDLDEHPDHKMLSLFFDKAIGIVRKMRPDYAPQILKRFAYALAYNAVADYSTVNNPETKRPEIGITAKYSQDIIDMSIYSWMNRIRFPVIDRENGLLWKTTIARALLKHKSQYIIRNADRIINSDEVYWSRRTDGIGYLAEIKTSSGNGEYLNDFMLFNMCNLDSNESNVKDYCWIPEEGDNIRTARFTWHEEQTIELIIIYGAINREAQIKSLKIELSNGNIFMVTDIPNNGNPVFLNVGHCVGITSCEITIVSAFGNAYGLSECEFYSSLKESRYLKPFIKILVNDNYVYQYVVSKSKQKLKLGLYHYGEEIQGDIKVIHGKSVIVNDFLLIDSSDQEIVLRAENNDGSIWDQVVIKIIDSKEIKKIKQRNLLGKKYLKRKKALFRFHNMLNILKNQGFSAVIKRTIRNGFSINY